MTKAAPHPVGERDPLLPSSASASPPPYLDHHPADSYAVLLVPVRLRRGGRCLAPCLVALFLLALAGFLVWPADPDVSLARLRLEHVSVTARPAVTGTISAALKVYVRNPDLFVLDCSRLDVNIGYGRSPRTTCSRTRCRAPAARRRTSPSCLSR